MPDPTSLEGKTQKTSTCTGTPSAPAQSMFWMSAAVNLFFFASKWSKKDFGIKKRHWKPKHTEIDEVCTSVGLELRTHRMRPCALSIRTRYLTHFWEILTNLLCKMAIFPSFSPFPPFISPPRSLFPFCFSPFSPYFLLYCSFPRTQICFFFLCPLQTLTQGL